MDVAWDAERFFAVLTETLGNGYHTCRDEYFFWLTPFPGDEHEQYARIARHGVRRLNELIPGLQVQAPWGGWPAVLFQSIDAQLAYDSLFPGSGARIISGGSYRSRPIGHLAIPVSDWDALDAAFAHELVHAVLSPRGAPTWFQEGVACEVETRLGNRSQPFSDRRALDDLVAYWRNHDVDRFWSARAFRDPESSTYAYHLAQIIVGRWTRNPVTLAAICALTAEQWQDQDAALGTSRNQLIKNVTEPASGRGWIERMLYAIFVDDPQP